jgi:hypothetical protein
MFAPVLTGASCASRFQREPRFFESGLAESLLRAKRGYFLLIVVNIQRPLPSLVGQFSTGVNSAFPPYRSAGASERFGRKVFSVEGDHGA